MNPAPQPPAATALPQAGGGVRRRWLYLVLLLTFLFVLMPFLFWQATWFGRPLTDAQIEKNLADREHPRKAQHALSQIADRMLSRDPALRASARRWYPQVSALSSGGVDELRVTSAWVMGQDNTAPEFHQALSRMLSDSHPMVRTNAALSLVGFGDAAGSPVIRSMLEPFAVLAPQGGALAQRLKSGDVINPGTLLGRIQNGDQKVEIRSQIPGTLDRWLVANGASVASGQAVVSIAPSEELVWEALRALYVIGQLDDLPAIQRYAHGAPDVPERVRQQAELAARAIRSRQRENGK